MQVLLTVCRVPLLHCTLTLLLENLFMKSIKLLILLCLLFNLLIHVFLTLLFISDLSVIYGDLFTLALIIFR